MSVIDNLNMRQGTKVSHAELVAVLSDVDSAEAVRHYVLQTMLPHAVVEVGGIDRMITLLSEMERQPRNIIVDISESSMPLSDLTQLAEVCEPHVSVIVIGERNDVGLFRDLLRMGVSDYISKPLNADLLQRCIHIDEGAAEPVQKARTGKVMTFVGARGGVGTSTIAANTAWHLAQAARRRVALIDLDLHGGQAALLLGVESNNSLVDILDNVARLDPQYMERTLTQVGDRLFLLGADLDLTEDYTPSTSALGRILEILCQHFHYVIIDLPARGGYLSQYILEQSHAITIVADASVRSARETARLLRLAEARESINAPKLLLNSPWQPGKGDLKLEDFHQAIGRAPSYVLPFDNVAVVEAENLGEPVVNGHGPFAKAMQTMLGEMLGQSAVKPKTHWWQRLLQWRAA